MKALNKAKLASLPAVAGPRFTRPLLAALARSSVIRMSKYHNDNSMASDPLGVSLSEGKLSSFKKELFFIERFLLNRVLSMDLLDEHLMLGDSRAAVVIETDKKLIVSAYTDELDCVALLEFPLRLVQEYKLKVGDRLLTVNTYNKGSKLESDLENGPDSYNRYVNFYPLIADFLSEDVDLIEKRKKEIEKLEWEKASSMGKEKINRVSCRDGNPYKCFHARS